MKKATLRQAQQILRVIGEHNLTGVQIQKLLVSGLFTDLLCAAEVKGFAEIDREAVRLALGLPKFTPDPEIVDLGELMIPEKVTIQEMVLAGKYDGSVSDIEDICEGFSISCRGRRRLYLAHFNKHGIRSWEVKRVVSKLDDKALALVEDLLTVGMHPKYSGLQLPFRIACLGSSADVESFENTVCVSRETWRDEPILRLHDFENEKWPSDCRFLLIGKNPNES